jgi:hypothetical protein
MYNGMPANRIPEAVSPGTFEKEIEGTFLTL